MRSKVAVKYSTQKYARREYEQKIDTPFVDVADESIETVAKVENIQRTQYWSLCEKFR
jgi:hypothetical protein